MANYNKTTWVNDAVPPLSAANLQKIENELANVSTITGTAAALAAANTVAALGQKIQQTDAPYLVAFGDGVTGWNSLPKYSPAIAGAYQYAYTETGNLAVTNAGADWTGLTATFSSDGVTPTELEAFCPDVTGEASVTTSTYGRLSIYEGATLIVVANTAEPTLTGTSARLGHVLAKDTKVYSAGTHTIKVTCSRSGTGGGSLDFLAGAGFRAYLRSRAAY